MHRTLSLTLIMLALLIILAYAALIWWTLTAQAAPDMLWSDLRPGEKLDYYNDAYRPCILAFDHIGADLDGKYNRLSARCDGALVDRPKVYQNQPYIETPSIPRIAWLYWGEVTVSSQVKAERFTLLLPELP